MTKALTREETLQQLLDKLGQLTPAEKLEQLKYLLLEVVTKPKGPPGDDPQWTQLSSDLIGGVRHWKGPVFIWECLRDQYCLLYDYLDTKEYETLIPEAERKAMQRRFQQMITLCKQCIERIDINGRPKEPVNRIA